MSVEKESLSRRKFVKISTAGIAGISMGSVIFQPTVARGYVPGDHINPDIDNTRVVYIHDPDMTTGPEFPIASTWSGQNTQTVDSVVSENIDKMACALAEEANISDAWHKIFRKPDGLNWNEVNVAIKTNWIEQRQSTRNAVIKKFCEVLVNEMGVTGSRIHIYDGDDGHKMLTYTGLPSGVNQEKRWGGITTNVSVPDPYNGTTTCVAGVANDTHILINMAVCKGHGYEFMGRVTMCLKNHYGTCYHNHTSKATDYVISINKSEAILGDLSSGVAKQQLCFVDALWASANGPTVAPDSRPDRFFMGTFGPIVDYLVTTEFRDSYFSSWTHNMTVINRFLSDYGYATSDLDGMEDAAEWTPSSVHDWRFYS